MKRHQSTGKEVFYSFDKYDPTKGWISKPNIRDAMVFKNKILNTNSKGLRGYKEYSFSNDHNKLRILLLGDSFTFGDEVSDTETYAYYLQKSLPDAEIINMGVHGYGHDQMLIILKEEGIKYKPDIVILGFIPFDMDRNTLNFRDYAKPKFTLKDNKLVLTGSPIPSPEETIKWDWVRPRIIDIMSIFRHKYRTISGLYTQERNKISMAILSEIIQTARNINSIPLFTYLPVGREISEETSLTNGEKLFFSMCNRSNNVTCFSTRQEFAARLAKGATFKEKGHWGPAGHLAVAGSIKRYLENEGMIASQN